MKLTLTPFTVVTIALCAVRAQGDCPDGCKATQHCDTDTNTCVRFEELCGEAGCAANEFCGSDKTCKAFSCANWYRFSPWRLAEQGATPMECEVVTDPNIWQVIYSCETSPTQGPKLYSNQKCTSMVGEDSFHCFNLTQDFDFTDYEAQVTAAQGNNEACLGVDQNPTDRVMLYQVTYDHPDQKAPERVDLDGEAGSATLQTELALQSIFVEYVKKDSPIVEDNTQDNIPDSGGMSSARVDLLMLMTGAGVIVFGCM
ncbi:expressed unknown protein [Seminavis robusta]|uniref:Uncharacterized protein n=1 Tax=Seminavis robusta TaxID=568900 RepID=A0A9N8DCN3_9STRA|nr:expressed unknown protein [Seminavis robusta]|eukprot:Sro85_g045440.1 n/a (257) ;mRNA; f:84551-85321